MQTKKFTITKKGRTWYHATLHVDEDSEIAQYRQGYNCKIKITPTIKDLEVGQEIELLVEDISVRSKYGTDLRFIVSGVASKEKLFIKTRYNSELVKRCKALGGTWDDKEKVWVFDAHFESEVSDLEYEYCSDEVFLEVKFISNHFRRRGPIEIFGYTIARAWGRDSGARLSDDVALIEGDIDSGGSVKNWTTEAHWGTIIHFKCSKARWATFAKDARRPESETEIAAAGGDKDYFVLELNGGCKDTALIKICKQ